MLNDLIEFANHCLMFHQHLFLCGNYILSLTNTCLIQALIIDKIARKFELVTKQIEEALDQIPYNKLNMPEEVLEQVQIFVLTADSTCWFIFAAL